MIIVGLLLLLFGTVFALQGANVMKGSAVMSGNSTYIYIGGALAVIGLILIIAGFMSRSKSSATSARAGSVQPGTLGSSTEGGANSVVRISYLLDN